MIGDEVNRLFYEEDETAPGGKKLVSTGPLSHLAEYLSEAVNFT